MTGLEVEIFVAICGCLVLLLLFVRYGRGALGHSVTYVAQHRECHPMMQVHNPFTVAANPDNAGGVELRVRSECDCQLRLYWGLSYAALAGWPRLAWPRLREECQAGSLWESHCLQQGTLISLDGGQEWRWHGVCPVAEHQQVLLAVLLVHQDEPASTQVASLVAAVQVCGSEAGGARLLAQHVKLPSGQSWPLRPLYAPLGSTCVVCQAREATLTLLPCRHACLCDQCFGRTGGTACPMCRAHVVSYFRVDPQTLEATEGN